MGACDFSPGWEEAAKVEARHTPASIILALIPAIALTIGVPFANHLEPRILGLPFLLDYIVLWILLTPLFMFAVYAMEHRKP
jgi:hypothetical protein